MYVKFKRKHLKGNRLICYHEEIYKTLEKREKYGSETIHFPEIYTNVYKCMYALEFRLGIYHDIPLKDLDNDNQANLLHAKCQITVQRRLSSFVGD